MFLLIAIADSIACCGDSAIIIADIDQSPCYSEYQNDTPNGQQITGAAVAITTEQLLFSERKALGA
jgi:hypothetical protein